MKVITLLFVCLITVSPVFSGVCDPSCTLDPASKCLSSGRCLCWWGWTGTNAHYILTGYLRNRIVANQCNIPCSYSQYHRNINCAKVMKPLTKSPATNKCVVPHVNKYTPSLPCHPMCQASGYQSKGLCLHNGRCLCFWGWTGTNSCYVTSGKHKKKILADFCSIPCHYTRDYTNPSCLLTALTTTAYSTENPSTSGSTQLTTSTTTQSSSTETVSTNKPLTWRQDTTPKPTTFTIVPSSADQTSGSPTTKLPPATTTKGHTTIQQTTEPTTKDMTGHITHTIESLSTKLSTLQSTIKQTTTSQPTTQQPTTEVSTTQESTTQQTTTQVPSTQQLPTPLPTTQKPTTTQLPTTEQPTTLTTTTDHTTIKTTATLETTTNPTTKPATKKTTKEAPTTEEPEPTEPTEPGQFALSFKKGGKKSPVYQKSMMPMAVDNSKEATLLGIVSASLILVLIVVVTGWMMHKKFGRHAGYQRLLI